jgi:hypothetical protein
MNAAGGWIGSSYGAFGAPDTNRTCDPRFRKPLLYPTELRGLDADSTIVAQAFSTDTFVRFVDL